MKTKAWIAKAAEQPMVLETVDPGPLGVEDVEVVVEHCGWCHSSGSLAAIETMLDFASRHNVAPQTEHFPMSNINGPSPDWNQARPVTASCSMRISDPLGHRNFPVTRGLRAKQP
jgi:D-arabinose 1-dehydrogenase-like Zn-dependent alcohol dehydrogenase